MYQHITNIHTYDVLTWATLDIHKNKGQKEVVGKFPPVFRKFPFAIQANMHNFASETKKNHLE